MSERSQLPSVSCSRFLFNFSINLNRIFIFYSIKAQDYLQLFFPARNFSLQKKIAAQVY